MKEARKTVYGFGASRWEHSEEDGMVVEVCGKVRYVA